MEKNILAYFQPPDGPDILIRKVGPTDWMVVTGHTAERYESYDSAFFEWLRLVKERR